MTYDALEIAQASTRLNPFLQKDTWIACFVEPMQYREVPLTIWSSQWHTQIGGMDFFSAQTWKRAVWDRYSDYYFKLLDDHAKIEEVLRSGDFEQAIKTCEGTFHTLVGEELAQWVSKELLEARDHPEQLKLLLEMTLAQLKARPSVPYVEMVKDDEVLGNRERAGGVLDITPSIEGLFCIQIAKRVCQELEIPYRASYEVRDSTSRSDRRIRGYTVELELGEGNSITEEVIEWVPKAAERLPWGIPRR